MAGRVGGLAGFGEAGRDGILDQRNFFGSELVASVRMHTQVRNQGSKVDALRKGKNSPLTGQREQHGLEGKGWNWMFLDILVFSQLSNRYF